MKSLHLKRIKLRGIIAFGGLVAIAMSILPACQKCELIEQDITYPPVDTIKVCEGSFYFNKLESAMDTHYTFNSLEKPIPGLIVPTQKAGPFGIPFSPFSMVSNFSAYDTLNNIYVFEYTTTTDPTIRFYSNQTKTNTSTQSSSLDISVCPVFHKGRLYKIFLETSGTELTYSIGEVNPITGLDGVGLAGGTVTINSPANPRYTSSAATSGNLIYFLTGTNLIEFNTETTFAQYFDIDPTYDAITNEVTYQGLEYDRNQDMLTCIQRGPDGSGGYRNSLVTIKVSQGGIQLNQVFNITANLPPTHSPTINFDFYSTTFDACDTTYYITEQKGVNPLMTNLIEINLNQHILKLNEVSGYWYGMEFTPE